MRRAPLRGAVQPRRRDPPGEEVLAAGGLRGLAATSLLLRLGRRPRAGGVTWSFPPAVWRHAPPTFRCCDGAPAVEGLQARAGCGGASLRWRCSAQPAQTAGTVGVRDDGLLDLTDARALAAHPVTRIRLGVASGVNRCGRRLVLSPLA
jgi:hypothetical protein